MHGTFDLDRVPHSLTYGCATQMRNLTRTSSLSKYIPSLKTRRNVCTQAELWRCNKPRSRGWCSPLQVVWMSNLSQATSGTPVSKERRGLLDYDVLDKNQNLICHSENIPPMLKGIVFNEESKSQPKRDGLWHRKRTCRTLDLDLEKRYWILHIHLLLPFNVLIVVGSCWNRGRFLKTN